MLDFGKGLLWGMCKVFLHPWHIFPASALLPFLAENLKAKLDKQEHDGMVGGFYKKEFKAKYLQV